MNYEEFLKTKQLLHQPTGPDIDPSAIHPLLKPHQRDVTRWAVKKGRCACFLDTGLGKTFIQLEWARLLGVRTLILAPLSVARQTVQEAKRIDLTVHYTRSGEDLTDGINITNYEMADKFSPDDFGAVVLDESSILKSLESRTRARLIEQWKGTPYKLCATATPAPNDLIEIANHADFLEVMTRKEVFGAFFMNENDGGLVVRLKGHAVKPFYEWLASWAVALKTPADLGYDAEGYNLPPLNMHAHIIPTDYRPDDKLFFTTLKGVTDRARVRKATMPARIAETVALVNGDTSGDQWIVWHELNDEGYALVKAIDGAVLVEGKMSAEEKSAAFEAFIDGQYRALVVKPSIAGFGMNFQNSHRQAWCGINDSYESLYQAVRRQWRYGQNSPVDVHLIYADVQQAIYENVQAKQKQATDLTQNLIEEMKMYSEFELRGQQRDGDYETDEASGEKWRYLLGDCSERLKDIDDESVHLTVTSPPFVTRYVYSASERDLGNSRDLTQFMAHFRFTIRELYRVTVPGGTVCIHCQDVRTTKRDTGHIGLVDFPAAITRFFQRAGFVYYQKITIQKNAQAQAKRTNHKGLMFKTLRGDSRALGGALADYVIVFKKPGDDATPYANQDVSAEDWIRWAQPVWLDINETNVLPTQAAASSDDEMHLCPLQLDVIERCIKLWTQRGETVLDPFGGVGSTGYEAVILHRKAILCELNPQYFKVGQKNMAEAEHKSRERDLFTWAEEQAELESEAV